MLPSVPIPSVYWDSSGFFRSGPGSWQGLRPIFSVTGQKKEAPRGWDNRADWFCCWNCWQPLLLIPQPQLTPDCHMLCQLLMCFSLQVQVVMGQSNCFPCLGSKDGSHQRSGLNCVLGLCANQRPITPLFLCRSAPQADKKGGQSTGKPGFSVFRGQGRLEPLVVQ